MNEVDRESKVKRKLDGRTEVLYLPQRRKTKTRGIHTSKEMTGNEAITANHGLYCKDHLVQVPPQEYAGHRTVGGVQEE